MKKPKKIKPVIENEKTTLGLNQILKPILFVVFAIILEIINFAVLKLRFLPVYFFFDLGAFLIIAGIIFVSNKNWLANTFFFFFFALQALFNILNGTLLNATDDVFFFEVMTLMSEGFTSFSWTFIDFSSITFNSLLLLVSIISIIFLDKYGKFKRFKIKKITKPILLLVTFFSSLVLGVGLYSAEIITLKANKDKSELAAFRNELWEETEYKITGLETFGTYGFYIKDFYNQFLKRIDFDSKLGEYVAWIKEGETTTREDAKLYGKNLIMLCMESIDNFAIDEINTPLLWDILNNSGIGLQNFYSKNKTNITEDISLLGYIPKTSVFKTDANTLAVKYSLPNLFKALGYKADYFHSYISSFYYRKTVNKNIGFQNTYFLEDADFANKTYTFNEWNSEVDYFNAVKEKMIPTDGSKFFSFYMTVSGHGEYDYDNPNFAEYYQKYDSNLASYKQWLSQNTSYSYPTDPETEHEFKNFKCAAMDVEAMLNEMIDYLRMNNLMQDTAIVLFADHDCFYNELSTLVKGDTSEKYHIPCGIYTENENLEPQVITDFTTVYNIYPTICDLYGLPYNTNLCHSVSIFDEDLSKNVMYSTEARVGFFDQNCSSVTLLDLRKMNENVTDEQVEHFLSNAKLLREKQKKFNFIYKSKWTVDVLN